MKHWWAGVKPRFQSEISYNAFSEWEKCNKFITIVYSTVLNCDKEFSKQEIPQNLIKRNMGLRRKIKRNWYKYSTRIESVKILFARLNTCLEKWFKDLVLHIPQKNLNEFVGEEL